MPLDSLELRTFLQPELTGLVLILVPDARAPEPVLTGAVTGCIGELYGARI